MPQSAIRTAVFRTLDGHAIIPWSSQQGIPITGGRTGNTFFVNETLGDDDNAGGPDAPFASLGAAQAAAVANNGDTIYITGTVHVSATLTLAKNGVNYIGVNGPGANDRARISQTGSTVFSPLVSLTAQNCGFYNIGTFHGFADASAQVCWADSGGRNYYEGCDLLGGGNATAAAHAGMRSLVLSGSTGENEFINCVFGLDTILRATGTNATVEISGGSPRNVFENCLFRSWCSNAADLHMLVGSGGIDRYALLKGCGFLNFTGGGGTALTADLSIHASAGGFVVLDPKCYSNGATKVSAAGPVVVTGPVPTGATSSLGVAAA